MKQNYRAFLGTPVRDRLTRGLLGRVADLVVNPVNGEVLALHTHPSRKLLVPTVDVLRVSNGEVWLENPEAITRPDEIVRIAEVIAKKTPIVGNKVFTVSRAFLGEVLDFEFETNGWALTQLSVGKKILGIPTDKKLINVNQIIRIAPREITVRDLTVPIKAKITNKIALPDLDGNASFRVKK
jgi:uncharacterized protein YrrD